MIDLTTIKPGQLCLSRDNGPAIYSGCFFESSHCFYYPRNGGVTAVGQYGIHSRGEYSGNDIVSILPVILDFSVAGKTIVNPLGQDATAIAKIGDRYLALIDGKTYCFDVEHCKFADDIPVAVVVINGKPYRLTPELERAMRESEVV